MKKLLAGIGCLAFAASISSCAYMPGGTNLAQVASDANLEVVTTGDGNYPAYHATGHYTGTEIGIGIGIPFLLKLVEIYPAATNEDLLTDVAREAQGDGAAALINTTPAKSLYTGFPFGIIGLYVDSAEGTGITPR